MAINETRSPITDVDAWARDLDLGTQRALRAFAELMLGAANRDDEPENATAFTKRHLGVRHIGATATEESMLAPVARLTTALALAELIAEHGAEVGSGGYSDPPAWMQTEIGEACYRHPACIRAAFPAGTLIAHAPAVVAIRVRDSGIHPPQITVFVRSGEEDSARAVLDCITARARELSPYRGRVVRATDANGLALSIIDLPTNLNRTTVIVDSAVWQEVDLSVAAVRDQHEMLNRLGLGSRRGVLLVGPPGTGKSAVSAVVARELAGAFTIVYVEAKAGARFLTTVVEETQRLGGPVCLILEDLDLWCRDRRTGGSGGLSELLQAMDIASESRILTLASTNDAATLDKAAIRTGRFDSIVEIGFPDRADAARILSALIGDIGGDVDTAAVAAALPDATSGSDIREIVRRAVLSGNGQVSTEALLAEVGSGRYRAELPAGAYL